MSEHIIYETEDSQCWPKIHIKDAVDFVDILDIYKWLIFMEWSKLKFLYAKKSLLYASH